MTALIKKELWDAKKSFAMALRQDEKGAERYILGVWNTLLSNDKLQQCTPTSIKDAAITSAVLGVPIDARQLAYLIPYGNKAQFQLSYKGYVYLAKKNPEVDNIWSHIVYEDDNFSIDYGENKLIHIPNLDSPKFGKDAHIKYIYAIVRFRTSSGRGQMFEVMTLAEVKNIESKSKRSSAWLEYFGEMGRKTVIKRLNKHAQLGDEIALADEIDNAIENHKLINVTPDGNYTVEDDEIIDKLQALSKTLSESKFLSIEELNKFLASNSELMEEIAGIGKGSELNKLIKETTNNIKFNTIEDYLDNCEDEEALDAVYNNWKSTITAFPAKMRDELSSHYYELKQHYIQSKV